MIKTFSKQPAANERTRDIPCPICLDKNQEHYHTLDSSRFVQCKICGLVYQNPQPSPGDLIERYDDEYYNYEQENANSFFSLMQLGLNDVGFFREEQNLKKLGEFLDIGCATGRLLHWVKQRGWKTLGVEVCKPAAEFGRQNLGLRIHTQPLESLGLGSESFSVIHASHLIEHLTDPRSFLLEINRLLHPRGRLILTTPNTSSWQCVWFKGKWRSLIQDHTCLFSSSNLKLLLEQTGFQTVFLKTWGGLAAGAGPLFIKNILDKQAKRLDKGDVMIVMAEKPDLPESGDRSRRPDGRKK